MYTAAPPIAIITTCRNYGRWLPECIASVRASTFGDYEHIIVDDASRDDTRQIAYDLMRDDDRLDMIPLSSHHGHVAAQNVGWRSSTAPWLLKLDADDTIEPTYLARILAAAKDDPARNVIFSWCHLFGDEDRVYAYPPFNPALMGEQFQIPGPAAIRRDLLIAVDGFRETPCAEDWDFYVRAHQAVGLVPYQIAAPLWNYRQHCHPERRTTLNQEHLPALKVEWAKILATPRPTLAAG